MQNFSGLRSRQEDARFKAARNLKRYVATELREVSQELTSGFLEDLNHTIYELVSSSEVHEKKGGILAIGECYDYAQYCKNVHKSNNDVRR